MRFSKLKLIAILIWLVPAVFSYAQDESDLLKQCRHYGQAFGDTAQTKPDPLCYGAVLRAAHPSAIQREMASGIQAVGYANLLFTRTPPSSTKGHPRPTEYFISGSFSALNDILALSINGVARETVVLDGTVPSILTFPTEQSGKVYPLRTFETASLVGATDVAADPAHQELAVSRATDPAILFYSLQADNHGRRSENSKALLREIKGDKTLLSSPSALVVLADEVFVTDRSANQLLVFSRKASGNTEPLRVLRGDQTGIDMPVSVAFRPKSHLLEVTNQSGKVLYFKPTDSGNVTSTSPAPQ